MEISGTDRAELESWLRAQSLPQALAMRARVVLGSAAGESVRALARAAWSNPDYGVFVAAALSQRGTRRVAHPAAQRAQAADNRGQGAGGD